jgi:glucose dehydrogenase
MVASILSVFAVLFGFLLMFKGLDTLIVWRAWFFFISGLVLFVPGVTLLLVRIRRHRNDEQ